MTIKEKVIQIKKSHKWYAITEDEKDRIWLINTASRILNGTSKISTIERFFNKLGYNIKIEVIYDSDKTYFKPI